MKTHKQRVSIVRNYLSTAIAVSDQQSYTYMLLGTDEFHATDAFDELQYACEDGNVEQIADAVYNVLLESEEMIREYFGNPWNHPPNAEKLTVEVTGNFDDDALTLAQEICK